MTRDYWDHYGSLGIAWNVWDDKGCLGLLGMTRNDWYDYG